MSCDEQGAKSKGFLRSSMVYAFGDLLTKGARIILVPYFVWAFTKAELGELAILTAISIATWTLCSFGLPLTVQRQYFDYQSEGERFVFTIYLARLLLGLPVVAGLFLAGLWWFRLQNVGVPASSLLVAVLNGYLRGGVSILEAWFIAREEPVRYRVFTLFQFVTSSTLIILFISFLKLGVAGAIVGELISYVLWTVISLFLLARVSRPSWAVVRWREILAYCSPAIPHAFFMWGLSGADRLILLRTEPLEQIGIYDVSYLLASFLSIVTMSLRAAWLPRYFRAVAANGPEAHRQYGEIASVFFAMVTGIACVGFWFAPEAVSVVIPSDVGVHVGLFRIVLIGFLGMAFFVGLNQPLLSERRIGSVACISGMGLLVNVGLNFVLIPSQGVYGAAVATVVAYGCMSIAAFVLSKNCFPVTLGGYRVILGLFAFGGAACVAWGLGAEPWRWGFFVRTALAVAVAVPLIPMLFRRRPKIAVCT